MATSVFLQPQRLSALAVLGALLALAWPGSPVDAPGALALSAQPRTGAALLALGLAWAGWAAWRLAGTGTPLRPGAVPRVLVDDGPFRLGRHPMALGGAAALVGAALTVGSLPALGAAVAWIALQQAWVLPAEETVLRQRFGGWYRDYAERTRRWL